MIVDFSQETPRQIPKGKRRFVYHVFSRPLPTGQASVNENLLAAIRVEKYSEDDEIRDTPLEQYSVTLYDSTVMARPELSVFCTCQGFNIQKYDKRLHKHCILAKHHLDKIGELMEPRDTITVWLMEGTGQKIAFEFVETRMPTID